MRQKARYGSGRVPRLPGLRVAGLQQLGAFGAPRGGAVREQQAQAGPLGAQRLRQDGRRARFAQGDGVYPQGALVFAQNGGGGISVPETLGHPLAIQRLGARAGSQFAAQQRLGHPGGEVVEGVHGGQVTSLLIAACARFTGAGGRMGMRRAAMRIAISI